MTIEQILLSYVKSLYYINNRIRNKHSKYSVFTPYIQHRIGMDLELARANIENELLRLAIDSHTKIPVIRKRKHLSNIESITTFVNSKITNSSYIIEYTNKDEILYYANQRYHKLFKTLLFPKVILNSKNKYVLSHKFPYLSYTKLRLFYT